MTSGWRRSSGIEESGEYGYMQRKDESGVKKSKNISVLRGGRGSYSPSGRSGVCPMTSGPKMDGRCASKQRSEELIAK
jgi:hypothetical protein